MSIKINFDVAHNPEEPTIVLAKRNGDKLGLIDARGIEITDSMNDASEITFSVYKEKDGKRCHLWEQIVDFKLVYCVEWDVWFEIRVELDESNETKKTVFCTRLGCAELSQINLYDVEINTENDILREDYEIPTVLYSEKHPEASLLHRIMEKAPHYSVAHVDATIADIQRTYEFDDTSIYDAFQEIAEEIHCLFVLDSNSRDDGGIRRTVSVYDLESNCMECEYRGEFTEVCPKCGSKNVSEGYGNDTAIFVSADEIAEDIQLSSDTDEIKNCFKLEAGDDLMTATIRNCNPNGSDYIWYISDAMKVDMSPALVKKLNDYDELYASYYKDYIAPIDESSISAYNALVRKYKKFKDDLTEMPSPIKGYRNLMLVYYDSIDLALYLKSGLMPDAKMQETDAKKEAAKLTTANLSPVAAASIKNMSVFTADNIVLSMAKIVVDSRYKVSVSSSTLENSGKNKTWKGVFVVTNYSDKEDTATSASVSVVVNDDYETFVRQKIEKAMAKGDDEDMSISGLFKKELADFKVELTKYSLNRLLSFHDACQSAIDILVEQGIADKETWSANDPNLYDDLYLPYIDKMKAIEDEMNVRQKEVETLVGKYDDKGELIQGGVQTNIEDIIEGVQDTLDFEKYLGKTLWLEFCSFRRDDSYSNDNYISDGLGNAELIQKANEFIDIARNEIYKSGELQRTISANLKNLLVIEKFAPLVKDFQIGNWIRVMVDDAVYKLRLIEYSIDYDDIANISVEFSDVVKASSSIKSVKDVLEQASSMATSYESVKRQAKQGEKGNAVLNSWIENGLNATNTKIVGGADNQAQTWDNHGMLFRKFDVATNDYEPTQMKIINSTMAITDDDWKTTKTAVGEYYYIDPTTKQLLKGYGVNAEVIIGKLVLGEALFLSNKSGNLSFDDKGLMATSQDNKKRVVINPDDNMSIFKIQQNTTGQEVDFSNVLSFGSDGNLVITGDIMAKSLTLLKKEGEGASPNGFDVSGFADVALSGSYNDLKNKPVLFSGNYNDLTNKPNIGVKMDKPNNDAAAKEGQYISKTSNGQVWRSADTSVSSGGYFPICGKAVYDYAVPKKQKLTDAEKLLYIDKTGNVASISIEELKTLLGIKG